MLPSKWHTLTLDYDRDSEFTGDDVDQYSELLDLQEQFEFITVMIPALSASGAVTPYIQRDVAVATVPLPVHHFNDSDADGTVAQATTSGAGSIVVIFRIGGAQYIRLRVGADQTANRVFYVRGYNRN